MDASLIAFLLAAATRITGLPAVSPESLPAFMPLSAEQMAAEVCSEGEMGCRSIAAFFDPMAYRILYRDSLDLEDPIDNSYLLHEIVHVLQYRQVGVAMYADCRALFQTEVQAYRAQNGYLRLQGQLMRVGQVLQFATCAQESGTTTTKFAPN